MAQEDVVLKLVHPGGFVETHRQPVAASEVMARNPRHFVTRPDVFRFPWIVVRPESLLMPGNVFFIVPHHTLHRLIQDSPRPSPRQLLRCRVVALPPAVNSSDDGDADEEASRGSCRPKSCLKKEGSASTSRPRGRRRRVEFRLPGEHHNVDRDERNASCMQ